MDPMLATGQEKISAMGYGAAINALSEHEGGIAKFFSQRFAQVTNPPLDSIREQQGMTLRVALGSKPKFTSSKNKQIILSSPILTQDDLNRLKDQEIVPIKSFDMTFQPDLVNETNNESIFVKKLNELTIKICNFAKSKGGIVILSDLNIDKHTAPIPMILAVSALNQALIDNGLRMNVSVILETGQISSSHHIACALGFGASAIFALSVKLRADEKFKEKSDEGKEEPP